MLRLFGIRAGLERGADEHDVLGDDGRRVQSDRCGDEIEVLIELRLQIDDALASEARDRLTGLRIEGHEAIAWRHVEDSFFPAIGPVGQAAARKLSRRRRAARTFALAVHPEQLSGGGIERHDRAPGAGRRIHAAVDHQRRRFEIHLRPRAEVVGLETPGDFEVAEVRRGDPIERRVPRVTEIAAVGRPFALVRAGLSPQRARGPEQRGEQRNGQSHSGFHGGIIQLREAALCERPVAQAASSTEGGEAPGGQGATTENIGSYLREEQGRQPGCIAGRTGSPARLPRWGPNAGAACTTGC